MKKNKRGRPALPKSEKRIAVSIMLPPDLAKIVTSRDDKNSFMELVLRDRPEIAKQLKHS